MLKRKISNSDYFLIAANLFPVIGVFAWNWNPHEVFIVYCLETIIVGLITLTKMGIISFTRKDTSVKTKSGLPINGGLFLMLFFIFHFGMFVAIQMGLFFSITGIAEKSGISFFSFIYKWPSLLNRDGLIMVGIFFFCYALKMIVDFIMSGEYKNASLVKTMFFPYIRVVIQQFAVIFGGMFLMFGAGKIFILIFACIKIVIEVFINYDAMIAKELNESTFNE